MTDNPTSVPVVGHKPISDSDADAAKDASRADAKPTSVPAAGDPDGGGAAEPASGAGAPEVPGGWRGAPQTPQSPTPKPPDPDEPPRPGPAGPRTPYPVNDPGIADPGNQPGADPDYIPPTPPGPGQM